MYVKGYNSNGEVVKDKNGKERKIAIESFGYSPDNVNTEFDFVNVAAVENGTKVKVDRTAQSYPDSGKGFYIKIKDPNASETVGDSTTTTTTTTTTKTTTWVNSMKLVIETQNVDIKTESKATLYNSYVYRANASEIAHGKDNHYCGHTEECPGHGGEWEWDDELNRYVCVEEPWYHNYDCIDLTCNHERCKCDWQRYKISVSTEQRQSFMEVTQNTEVNIQSNTTEINRTISGSSSSSSSSSVTTGGDAIEYNFHIAMSIGGKVWEDVPSGKGNLANGLYDEGHDRVIPNVKVSLYDKSTGKLAELDPSKTQKAKATNLAMIECQMNPTYTDDFGEYLFIGVNPLKKYYVKFEYDGQEYIPTNYTRCNSSQLYNVSNGYNSVKWIVTSKGTEKVTDRNNYDKKFSEIGSSPTNYLSSNSLGVTNISQNNGYNKSYTKYELMGYKLNANGDYEQVSERLIDSFYTLQNGKIVETNIMQQGRISQEIKKFVLSHKQAPSDSQLKDIYYSIAGGNMETLQKLQFIEDCKIQSYTQAQGAGSYDLYPVQDEFYLGKLSWENWGTRTETVGGITAVRRYSPLMEKEVETGHPLQAYPGQLQVNQGLWKRQESDLALIKDVAYAATRINGKTEVYSYDKRQVQYSNDEIATLQALREQYEINGRTQEDYQKYIEYKAKIESEKAGNYWEVSLRLKNYVNYYGTPYTQELYKADYAYRNNATNYSASINNSTDKSDLELYVTYKLTIRNVSNTILGEVTEIVDFYDDDYEYVDKLSWVMYKSANGGNLSELSFAENDYYESIDALTLNSNISSKNKANVGKSGTNSVNKDNGSQYVSRSNQCTSNMTKTKGGNYNAVYIKSLAGKKLESGEEAYIYLTFKVKDDYTYTDPETNQQIRNGIRLDERQDIKYNYAEINGYKTYYKDNTKLPNNVIKKSTDIAGKIDHNSNPGNLCREDINNTSNGQYEQNFENDTDRAKGIKITIEKEFIRNINGTVWEDARTQNVSNSLIGDGVRQPDEIGINGVTVELVEKLENGQEFVWQTTQSGSGAGKRINLYTGQVETYNYNVPSKGYYTFTQIITGNYIVRFHYGNTYETVLTSEKDIGGVKGKNTTSYNGQDFKSTVYQKNMTEQEQDRDEMKDIATNNESYYISEEYYDIKAADAYGANLSDAKDIKYTTSDGKDLLEQVTNLINTGVINRNEVNLDGNKLTYNTRAKVNNYSKNDVTNHIAEVLASPYSDTINKELIDELIANTNMTAETAIIVLEGEYNRTGTNGDSKASNGSGVYLNGNDVNGKYTIYNVDFGLTERPKAQLELDKKISNVRIVLANSNILFDAVKSATDIAWTNGQAYNAHQKTILTTTNKDYKGIMNNKIYENNYSSNGMGYNANRTDTLKDRYSYRTEIADLVASRYDSSRNNGLINITMDDELMHGATIRISYILTVTNIGETDYIGEDYYYKGIGATEDKLVKTSASIVTDYVANNLQFRQEENQKNSEEIWKTCDTSKDANIAQTKLVNEIGINPNVAKIVGENYNVIIKTDKLNKELLPVSSRTAPGLENETEKQKTYTTVELVLSQLITKQNTADDRTYDNIAEITSISNTVGRRMAYSIQGNQDPTKVPSEIDSIRSEQVVILPPTGIGEILTYISVAIAACTIIVAGAILIKKLVLK